MFVTVDASLMPGFRLKVAGGRTSELLGVIFEDNVTVITTSTTTSEVVTLVGKGNPGDGRPCVFPFLYQGKQYDSCTCDGAPAMLWCATTSDLERDLQWGFCDTVTFNASAVQCQHENDADEAGAARVA